MLGVDKGVQRAVVGQMGDAVDYVVGLLSRQRGVAPWGWDEHRARGLGRSAVGAGALARFADDGDVIQANTDLPQADSTEALEEVTTLGARCAGQPTSISCAWPSRPSR
jgi:hypothetical protein